MTSKIKPITKNLKKSDGYGIFHDSRADSIALAKYANMLAEKLNEVISKINEDNEKKSPT
jgi:hypothetical protein